MLALRYGIPTVLIEGRQVRAVPHCSNSLQRVARAMIRAIERITAWAVEGKKQLAARPNVGRPGDQVPIRSRYLQIDDAVQLPMKCVSTGRIQNEEIEGRYSPHVVPTITVTTPTTYAVHRKCAVVNQTLERHGFQCLRSTGGPTQATQFQIVDVAPSKRDGRAPRHLQLSQHNVQIEPNDYLFYDVRQVGGHALAVLLEPGSKYGLARFDSCRLELHAGTYFPVLRCESVDAAPSPLPLGPRRAC
jgi:hypothetical protein